jgi:hypothetical protein
MRLPSNSTSARSCVIGGQLDPKSTVTSSAFTLTWNTPGRPSNGKSSRRPRSFSVASGARPAVSALRSQSRVSCPMLSGR